MLTSDKILIKTLLGSKSCFNNAFLCFFVCASVSSVARKFTKQFKSSPNVKVMSSDDSSKGSQLRERRQMVLEVFGVTAEDLHAAAKEISYLAEVQCPQRIMRDTAIAHLSDHQVRSCCPCQCN